MASYSFSRLKFLLFSAANLVLSDRVKHAAGRSALLKPVRDFWFRPYGLPVCMDGSIAFESLQFFFSAPYQIYSSAHNFGIESKICRLIISQCSDEAVCIDVGANFGFVTLIMALSVRPNGVVLSFEPVPFIQNVLKKNITANQLDDVVTVFPVAVGASTEKTMRVYRHGTRPSEVPVTTLDTIVSEQNLKRLDIVKIDVDGGDWDVLMGGEQTLRRFHPILIVEMAAEQKKIYQGVKKLGYKHLLDMSGRPVTPGNWPPNLIATMHEIRIPRRGSLRDNV